MRPTRIALFGIVLALVGIALIAVTGGCGRDALVDERNIYYVRGMKLREAKKNEEAVEAFQTCLRLSPQSAMAHLQLAMIYDQALDDPLAAAYHYRSFLEMRPDHADAEAVRGWAAKAEQRLIQRLQQAAVYAAINQGGDGPPISDTAGPTARELALLARIQELTDVNESLRKSMDEPVIDPTVLPTAPTPAATTSPATAPAASASPATAAAKPPTPTTAASPAAAAATPATPTAATGPATAAAKPPTPPGGPAQGAAPPVRTATVPASSHGAASPATPAVVASAERTHVVAAGDTLSSLSRRYYGNTGYWPQLQQANRDLLGGRNELKVGMRLKVPALQQLKSTNQAHTSTR